MSSLNGEIHFYTLRGGIRLVNNSKLENNIAMLMLLVFQFMWAGSLALSCNEISLLELDIQLDVTCFFLSSSVPLEHGTARIVTGRAFRRLYTCCTQL